MADITPLLTLETLSKYLEKREVNHEIEQQEQNRFIRMNWKFEMGDAGVILSLNDAPGGTSRLEITCVTHNQYRGRRAQVVDMLNQRNRERAFTRSMDADGNVFLEYIGFYPSFMPFPEETFETIFGGALVHFQDDYATLEGVPGPSQQQEVQA
jgi:Putative bacterial sensory transduction regulator